MKTIESISLPQDLRVAIGSENIDFAVESNRAKPRGDSFFLIILGTFFLVVSIIIVSTADFENLGPGALFPGIGLLIGIGTLGSGIYSLFRKGGYFVGIPTRLINYQKGKIKSIGWRKFTGDVKVKGNAQKGDIYLQLMSGHIPSDDTIYIHDMIYIFGIPNALEIGQICKKRIKENAPFTYVSPIGEDTDNQKIREVPAGRDREIAPPNMESRKIDRSERILVLLFVFGIVIYSLYEGQLLWGLIAAAIILVLVRKQR
ncbi:hypothetical protein V7O66_04970 [Methanolobus sp. ZRKC3]|uniref:hypothetical protein n=1 Tax=Methanolobus sp. ZRKC3 TaxID=3125786 RepID=UPI003249E0FF